MEREREKEREKEKKPLPGANEELTSPLAAKALSTRRSSNRPESKHCRISPISLSRTCPIGSGHCVRNFGAQMGSHTKGKPSE
jgi:hypothetical protein